MPWRDYFSERNIHATGIGKAVDSPLLSIPKTGNANNAQMRRRAQISVVLSCRERFPLLELIG